jgi:hypothetical protein
MVFGILETGRKRDKQERRNKDYKAGRKKKRNY